MRSQTVPPAGRTSVVLDAAAGHVKPDRRPFLKALFRVLEALAETWLRFERHKAAGKAELRKRLIASLVFGDGPRARPSMLAAQVERGEFLGWTFMPMRRINGVRAGWLAWPKS